MKRVTAFACILLHASMLMGVEPKAVLNAPASVQPGQTVKISATDSTFDPEFKPVWYLPPGADQSIEPVWWPVGQNPQRFYDLKQEFKPTAEGIYVFTILVQGRALVDGKPDPTGEIKFSIASVVVQVAKPTRPVDPPIVTPDVIPDPVVKPPVPPIPPVVVDPFPPGSLESLGLTFGNTMALGVGSALVSASTDPSWKTLDDLTVLLNKGFNAQFSTAWKPVADKMLGQYGQPTGTPVSDELRGRINTDLAKVGQGISQAGK